MKTKTKRFLFNILQKFLAIAFLAAAAAVEFSETADSTGGGVLLVVLPFCAALFFTKEKHKPQTPICPDGKRDRTILPSCVSMISPL